MADNITIKTYLSPGKIPLKSNTKQPMMNIPNYFNNSNSNLKGYDDRGFKLNDLPYSTEGNLTDRGYPSSTSGSSGGTVVFAKTNLTPQEMPGTASVTEPILEPVSVVEETTPNISYENIDFSKISATANDAINNKYVNIKDSAKQYWQGDLQYQERNDGSIKVMSSDGTPLGFITKDSLLDGENSKMPPTFQEESKYMTSLTPGEQAMAKQPETPSYQTNLTPGEQAMAKQPETPSYQDNLTPQEKTSSNKQDVNNQTSKGVSKYEDGSNGYETPTYDDAYQTPTQYGPVDSGMPQFGSDGLLIMEATPAGQDVINRLFWEIPTHAGGTHSAKLDAMIDNLTTEECVWVLSRIENEGFGQTGAGYSTATQESHQNFVQEQVIERYGGDIHNLLKHWGTYSYSGY